MDKAQDNGMLALVLGDEVGAAKRSLPPAGPDQPARMTVDTESLHLGRVRITFELSSYKRGKVQYWHWVASHAAQILPGS
ncbi:MAG: hypothetical protein F9K35_14390 [Burkholderiaceae bacterium]|nr:MAG: hypothetical protein F9K35_14390 [Burkholderiaceae bacterium]